MSSSTSPYETLPEELKELSQWLIWRLEERDGKKTKVPYQSRAPRQHASSTDAETWSDFDSAVEASKSNGASGIGFVFTAEDPYVGIDLDKCIDDRDYLTAEAEAIVEAIDSYAEYSQSGRGLHIIARGLVPASHKGGGVEIYSEGRYFVMTGEHLEGSPDTIENRQGKIEQLYGSLKPKRLEKPQAVPSATARKGPYLCDEEVLDRARSAANGELFKALYDRGTWREVLHPDTGEQLYPSQSEADLALCGNLAFWCGQSPAQIDRLFRGSKLFRKKWDERHHRAGRSYGQGTIDKALEGKTEFYGGTQQNEMTETANRGPSVATILIRLALERYKLGMSTEGEPYAVPTEGPRIARLLRGSRVSLGAELAAAYFDARGKAASRSALADALATIEGLAARCEPVELHLRTAQTDGGVVWLDLGHEKGNCVRIDADGWKLTDEPEVLFRRSPVTALMPEPSPDGDLLALRDLLALPEDSGAWPLIVGWLVGTMFPGMPRPVLLLTGEQGSGKSFITRKVAGVLDPAIPPTRCAPRDERDWIAATSASAVVALDNISTVQDWLSDAICRAVTGEGFVRRRLYTDNDVAVTTFRRSIIANGIDLGAYRGDLLDRSIIVELPRIEADRRRTEEDLDREYKRLLPKILAGLLDLAVKVLGELPTVQVHQPPRMADYARILAALDQATGSRTLDAYRSVGREALSSAVDADHVASCSRRNARHRGDLDWYGDRSSPRARQPTG